MYTIKQASQRSGVGVSLLRAWERRYGVVHPVRTAAGYRLYDEEAILRLRAMRRLIGDGWSARQAADHLRTADDNQVEILVGDSATDADETPAAPTSQFASRFLDAARRIDAGGMEAALDAILAAARFETVAEQALMPTLVELGDAWQRGEIDVAGEHAASLAVLRRLSLAYEAAGGGDGPFPILVGLGPGARHELGALAFATAARRAGLPVLYLGADLPSESWVAAATERKARAAVVAVPTRADVKGSVAAVRALRAARPELVVAVGGRGADAAARDGDALLLSGGVVGSVGQLRDLLTARERR